MFRALHAISSLLLSYSLLCLGHGLLNTLIGIRAVMEDFSDLTIGFIGSAYFAGFIIGVHLCSKLLSNVGHIRTFAAITSLTSAIAISYILVVSPFSWILFRFAYGICIAGLYMVIESWLTLLSTSETRGKILSIYMLLNYANIALGQVFLIFATPSDYSLFIIVSILISIALVPLTISKKAQQVDIKFDKLPFKKLLQISPVATLGCITSGLVTGSIWALAATYLSQLDFTSGKVGLLISMTFIGGLLLQWPIGTLSDKMDRRYVITGSCFLASIIVVLVSFGIKEAPFFLQAILFIGIGGFIYPLYSLSIALVHDYLPQQYLIKASGSLLQVHAVGACIGPICAATLMESFGPNGLWIFCGMALITVASFGYYNTMFKKKFLPREDTYVAMPRTSIAAFDLDPRTPEEAPATPESHHQ